MKKWKKKLLAFAVSAAVAFASVPALAAEQPEEGLESYYIKTIVSTIAEYYKLGVSEEEIYRAVMDYVMAEDPSLLEGAISAATSVLDQHSTYYTRDEMLQFVSAVENDYVGIGVTVQQQTDGILISEIAAGGPAEAAGILAGDKLVSVDGTDVSGMTVNEVSELIRGEIGTDVTVGVLRGEEPLSITVTRATVGMTTVAHGEYDGIGYLLITQFASTTPADVSAALADFDEKGIDKIIVDLRDNPGGELTSVLETLYQFVPKGEKLVDVQYVKEDRNASYSSEADFTEPPYELCVLINENTASAAELFVGAIRDHELGTLVGRTTYGKGTVQEFLGLRSLSYLELGDIKLTVAQYYLPSGECVDGVGIAPDYTAGIGYIPYDQSELSAIDFAQKYSEGDSGDGVLAIEQRLELLGYYTGEVDGEYDSWTARAASQFQADQELYPYGVMDITTQTQLKLAVDDLEEIVDHQLYKAIEVMGGTPPEIDLGTEEEDRSATDRPKPTTAAEEQAENPDGAGQTDDGAEDPAAQASPQPDSGQETEE